jgi:multidrug efflux pump subunit AcrB
MGIVVDDAIVIAENISRHLRQGMKQEDAAVAGTLAVALPVVASSVTTCIAFLPLFFFEGRFGKVIEHIPPIIFLMLGASLFESLFILPAHMGQHFPMIEKMTAFMKEKKKDIQKAHWFEGIEDQYGKFLKRILLQRFWIMVGFVLLLIVASHLGMKSLKFVMFPNEETRDIVISGEVDDTAKRLDTARLTKEIEDIIEKKWLGREVVASRTEIAESRRGGAIEENKFRMLVEITPKEKRKKSADDIVKSLEEDVHRLGVFKKMRFQKSRWGSDSGAAIEIVAQENSDERRSELMIYLAEEIKKVHDLQNVEIDQGLRIPEYRIDINREKIKRLSINPMDIANTIRASLQGTVIYEFFNGEEDVYVRFTVIDAAKNDIERVLDLPIENQGDYLVPLRDVVKVEKREAPNAVTRRNLKRTSFIFADMKEAAKKTPLEIADELEKNVFPKVLAKFPSAVLTFGGEILDTRESQSDFKKATIMALALIYIILVVLFNSLAYPLVIMLAIPFGVVGVVLAFLLHQKFFFGFYAAVGTLGLAGVVINDSIILLDKLRQEFDLSKSLHEANTQIAMITQTRLRAVVLTTVTTVAGVLPTAYGFAGYDAMLAEMMLALSWGLMFGTLVILFLVPCLFRCGLDLNTIVQKLKRKVNV